MTLPPAIESLVERIRCFLPIEVHTIDPETAALGYCMHCQLPWQSQIMVRQWDESTLLVWLEGLLAGAETMTYTHLRAHAEEPAAIGTDDAALVITHTDGLRADLLAAYLAHSSRQPMDEATASVVRDVGQAMTAIGHYGISGCPEALIIHTGADGAYGVRYEWDTCDGERPWTAGRHGQRIVIDIDRKSTRAEFDQLALDLARIDASMARRKGTPAPEDPQSDETDE